MCIRDRDYLEGQIPTEGFIFGDFMMADLSIASPFINAAYAGYEVDGSRWPNLAGLVARVKVQPQVAAVLEKEKRALGLDLRCREDDDNRQRVHRETPFECASTKSNSVFCSSELVRVIL